MQANLVNEGLRLLPGALERTAQEILLAAVQNVIRAAPFYRPEMPRSGRPFSIEMTNAGSLGWVSDREGYRYQARHPVTDAPWPAMPAEILDVWHRFSQYPGDPECCLINVYRGDNPKLGLHRDEDEETYEAPVVSVSLGESCKFRIGGLTRKDPTRSLTLHSGDVVVLAGPSRLRYHGVDRILAGSSTLIEGGGRINLTLRRVRP